MNKRVPRLMAALLLCFASRGFAADSNRVAGAVEPGSNWVRVKFAAHGNGAAYWCHASDCLVRTFKGTSRRLNAETLQTPVFQPGAIEMPPRLDGPYYSLTSVPLFALIPAKDPLVRLASYKAVRAQWSLKEIDFDQATGAPKSAWADVDGTPSAVGLDAKDVLAAGDVVVGDADSVETGKPMSLGVAAMAPAGGCKTDLFDRFYAAGDAGQYARAFAPIEVLLERAGLESTIDGTVARAHVQYGPPAPNGQNFDAVAQDVARGNLSVAENYALYLHAITRAAAQGYLRQPAAAPDALAPFEQRLIGCLAGVAGKSEDLETAILAASGKPGDFVQSARRFAQTEVQRLVDAGAAKAWPPPPSQLDLKTVDWKEQWSGLIADAGRWLAQGTQPPATPYGAKAPAAQTAANPVAPRRHTARPPQENPSADDALRRAMGGD